MALRGAQAPRRVQRLGDQQMAKGLLAAIGFTMCGAAAAAAPTFVPTFQSIGLYWGPEGGSEARAVAVQFREKGNASWREGLPLWFDARNAEYRGSIVELKSGTTYEIRLTLQGGAAESVTARTWSEELRIKKTVQVPTGSARL